jgi:hypothetical protein
MMIDEIRTNYAAASSTVDISADMWKPVERGVMIPVELETSYLHVITNSEVGSRDKKGILYYDKEGREAGGIEIWFLSPRVQYTLEYCRESYFSFPTTLPTTLNKFWTIEKRGYRTKVFCNGVLVLHITLSDATCYLSYWETYWGREVSGIEFSSIDSASDMYMIGK